MQTHYSLTVLYAFLFLSFLSFATATRTPRDVLRSSCAQARYPTLCVQTLSNSVGPTTKPLDLAQAAIKVSLARALNLSSYLKTLQSKVASSGSTSNRQRVAVKDCVVQISDSVSQLKLTLNELQHLRIGTFAWQMSNAQTWASTALTNGNLCINGLSQSGADGKVKLEVKRRVNDVAMLTSNALYMISRLSDTSSSGNGKPRSNSKNWSFCSIMHSSVLFFCCL